MTANLIDNDNYTSITINYILEFMIYIPIAVVLELRT